MATHPTIQQLDAYSLGLLGSPESVRVQRHLFECLVCLERLIAIDNALPLRDAPVAPSIN
jgi:hypothetical protein